MPKLDESTAARVQTGAESADSGEREPLDAGFYVVQLRAVTVKTLETSREPKLVGCPMWTWEFEIPEGEPNAGRRFWPTRILPADNGYQHADFMLAKFAEPFDAFGVGVDTDTDDLIGRKIRAYVIQSVIEKGPKAGKLRNEIEELHPLTDNDQTNGDAGSEDDYDPDF